MTATTIQREQSTFCVEHRPFKWLSLSAWLNHTWRRLRQDEQGTLVSAEGVLLATLVLVGMIAGLTALRECVVSELSDLGGSIQDFNQGYSYNGVTGSSATMAGSRFSDATDIADDHGDIVGQGDNCIQFNVPPTGEFFAILGSVATFNITAANSNSATGTLGDTNVNITTTGGGIVSQHANGLLFSESASTAGTYRIDFDDPVGNVELFFDSVTRDNILGNFTITLSDGTVLNNAAFDIIQDVITPPAMIGEFNVISSSTELLTKINVGGIDYLSDPTPLGAAQAYGRIVFTDVPPCGGVQCGGITSIQFEKSGGPNLLNAIMNVSGQVILDTN